MVGKSKYTALHPKHSETHGAEKNLRKLKSMHSGTFLVGSALSELKKKKPEAFERGYVTATLGASLNIVPSSENTED